MLNMGTTCKIKDRTRRTHQLSVSRQAELLNISRGSVYCLPKPTSQTDLTIMNAIDRLHLDFPFMGSRQLCRALRCYRPILKIRNSIGISMFPSTYQEYAERTPRIHPYLVLAIHGMH